jgi:hypothetical protein
MRSYGGVHKENIQVLYQPRICLTTLRTSINSGMDVHNSYCLRNIILVYNGAMTGKILQYILYPTVQRQSHRHAIITLNHATYLKQATQQCNL